jgi:hypothetical protein
LIRDSGFIPAQRNNTYDVISLKDGPDAPDRRVADWSAHRVKRLHVEAPRGPKAGAGTQGVAPTISAKAPAR